MKARIVLFFVSIIFIVSCNDSGTKGPGKVAGNTADSAESCNKEPIKDPNNPKPMALMMRQLAVNADSMKAQIIKGEMLDSLRYPFIRFYLAEPTDPSVLEPAFYENARLFQDAYRSVFTRPLQQERFYNLMIGKCVNCHENYCSGPLKRIRKLFTNQVPGSDH